MNGSVCSSRFPSDLNHRLNIELSSFNCCKCRFLRDSNKSASVRIHVAQNEVCEARSKNRILLLLLSCVCS